MKQHMMIIGAEIKQSGQPGKQDDLMELTLIPLTTVKKKQPSLMGMLGGSLDMETLMKQAQELQQQRTKVYIYSKEWINNGYKIAKHVTLELLPDHATGGIK